MDLDTLYTPGARKDSGTNVQEFNRLIDDHPIFQTALVNDRMFNISDSYVDTHQTFV